MVPWHVSQYLAWIGLRSSTTESFLRTSLAMMLGAVEERSLMKVIVLLANETERRDSLAIAAAGFAGWLHGKRAIDSTTAVELREVAAAAASAEAFGICRHAYDKAWRYLVPEVRAELQLVSQYPQWVMVGSPIGVGRIAGTDEASRHVPFVEGEDPQENAA